MMYIAINKKVARTNISRALRFRIQAETITDMIYELNRACERNNCDWTDYIIFSVD